MSSQATQIFQRAARLDFLTGFGISVGQRHVAMVELSKRLAAVSLQHYALAPLPPPDQADARRQALAAAVERFVSENNVDTDRTYLCLPRGQALLSRISLPVAAKNDLNQVVEFEIERLVPLSREEIYYDYLVREVGGPTGKLEISVASVPRRVVAEALAALEIAGFRARSVVITPIALLDYLAFCQGGPVEGVGVVVADADVVEFDFFGKGTLLASHLVRADEVSTTNGIGRLVSEQTLSVGASAEDVTIFGWQTTVADGGNPASAPLLAGELQADSTELLKLAAAKLKAPDEFFESADVAIVPAIGAALAAVREGAAGINLLPPEERRATDEGAPLLTFLLAGVVGLVTLVWLVSAMVKDYRIDQILLDRIAVLDPQMRAVQKSEEEVRGLRDRLKVLLQDDRRKISTVLKDLTDTVPADAYLTTFRVRAGKVELEGFARAASDLVPLLEKSSHFRNVQFTSPVTKVQNNQERFSLTAEFEE